MKLSVIIPVYNACDEVRECLQSLKANFNFQLGEIIVINDCSDVETTEFLEKFKLGNSNFKFLCNENNLGFVQTCNRGMKLANKEIIVLLNSDTKIPKEFCERIIKCFNSDPIIGVASPIGSYTNKYFIKKPLFYSLEKMNQKLREKHTCKYPLIPNAEGFCFCIRKKVIEQQGCLDEVYGKGYYEEVDFALRAITNGWKNVLIDDLYVYHKRHASFKNSKNNEQVEQNKYEFRKRWGNFKKEYIHKYKLKNPIVQIRKELFPIKYFLYWK